MDLLIGIENVLTPQNFMYCFLGVVLGTLVGVLPGLGPASAMSILLPVTLYVDSTGAIIMLAGLYYGAAYGGSTTSILVNIPGEVGSVPTCLDGFQMTKQGRAGQALWIAAVGSAIAGTFGAVMLSFAGPVVARYALRFGPPEYFGLIVFSLTALITLSGASLTRGLAAGMMGIFIALVGTDPLTGVARFNFGSVTLLRGFELIPVTIGLFGIAELITSTEEGIQKIYGGKISRWMPRGAELKNGLKACLRGTLLGSGLGLLPGMTPGLTSFLSYDLEKKISKTPEKFGTGIIEGVAGPEACNNATAQAGFLPLMVFGIPTGPSPAVILGALMLHGLQPGPLLFETNKLFVWTVIGSMYIGNIMLLILNLPLVGLWARISTIPYKYMAPTILGICVVGAYSPRNTLFDVWVALAFGIIGYGMRKISWPPAPMILGFILGPMLEQHLNNSLSMGGSLVFVTRPIALGFILLAIVVIVLSQTYLKRRVPKAVLEDDSDT